MDLYEIVTKLNGSINPAGDASRDDDRFENLKRLTELVDKLLEDIEFVSRNKISYEHSVKIAGEYAAKYLKDTKEVL